MLVDEIKIEVRAGHGGKGLVAFAKEMMMRAPTGGNGGRGGSVYAEGISDLAYLRNYRNKKDFAAEDGKPGGQNKRHGADGEDVFLKVPVGTVIHFLKDLVPQKEHTGERAPVEVVDVGQKILIAEGGRGGRGNAEFKSSKKTSPKFAQPGLPGEEFEVFLELQLIADIGLIGLPNVGKSSLLNELTPKAAAKVANYEFTTLEPNLGAYWKKGADWEKDRPIVLADIPGLIEGASEGRGLGHKFLRHIERTKTLFHLVSADSAHPVEDYKVVRKELEAHDPDLAKKKEYLFVSRTDLVKQKDLKKIMTAMKKLSKNIEAISIYNEASIGEVKTTIDKLDL